MRLIALLMWLGLSPVLAAGSSHVSREPAAEAIAPKTAEVKSSEKYARLDFDFIDRSTGKRFEYVRPKEADGEPNCVAAALRAGGYLPAFAINGTDGFAERILPLCFVQRKNDQGKSADTGEPGDLGVLRYTLGTFTTLAHMFLLLDNGAIFEKPTPQNRDLFRKSRLSVPQEAARDPNISLEIWKYQPQSKCPLAVINADFARLPENSLLKRVSAEIERRIFSDDWKTPSTAFTKAELNNFVQQHAKEKAAWFSSIRGGFKIDRDYPEFMLREFPLDIVKTAQRIPTSQ